jgi:hypothetical protein
MHAYLGDLLHQKEKGTMGSPLIGTLYRATGVTFEGRQDAVGMLQPGQPLTLIRDSYNAHDPHAISIHLVFDGSRKSLGYINREVNCSSAFDALLFGHELLAAVYSVGEGYSGFGASLYVSDWVPR